MLTQKEKVLNHLQNKESITPLVALGVYKIYRLAAVIYDLRCQGYQIDTLDCKDEAGGKYAVYKLIK